MKCEIKGYEFVRTCCACPEQYNVYQLSTGALCGYVNLRNGILTAHAPDYSIEEDTIIFHVNFAEWGESANYKGNFDSEEERDKYLTQIADRLDEVMPTLFPKYYLTEHRGLYEVHATRDIKAYGVVAGYCGGLVKGYHNLSQDGDCWVCPGGTVCDAAVVSGDAIVRGGGHVGQWATVTDSASVEGRVIDSAIVSGHATVGRNGEVSGDATVTGSARIERGVVIGSARVDGTVVIDRDAYIDGSNTCVSCNDDYAVYKLPPANRETVTWTRYPTECWHFGNFRGPAEQFRGDASDEAAFRLVVEQHNAERRGDVHADR